MDKKEVNLKIGLNVKGLPKLGKMEKMGNKYDFELKMKEKYDRQYKLMDKIKLEVKNKNEEWNSNMIIFIPTPQYLFTSLVNPLQLINLWYLTVHPFDS